MTPTTDTIIDILTDEMEETEVIFSQLLHVNLKGNFCLMKIAAVSVDANLRLWIKDDRGNWSEVHDKLMYCQFIVDALDSALKWMGKQKQIK
jgi:hypothetical protein